MLKPHHFVLALISFYSPLAIPRSPILYACPFCNAVRPSFAERRAESDALVVGEALGCGNFTVRQVLDGGDALGMPEVITVDDDRTPAGRLALLLGKRGATQNVTVDAWRWSALPVDETSASYFVAAPSIKLPAGERLPYFVKYLEHADPDVAEDVFREFGRAPFEAVAAVAPALPFASLRSWLVDADVPGERKGFYGLALGLAPPGIDRDADVALLRKVATDPAGEFRAGFDGVLGGLLWAEGAAALDLVDERFLRNSQAAEGDVRHAQAALRFYLQYGREIPEDRLIKSIAVLLDRPSTAAGAIQDLTRHKAWGFEAKAAKLFGEIVDDPALDRAVVGYLLLSPEPSAAAALSELRDARSARVAEAERAVELQGVRIE